MFEFGFEKPICLGMGFAGAEVPNDTPQETTSLILPENTYRPPQPERREFGFNAAKVWKFQTNDQRQHLGARAQSD